jgi:hypothetical protein
LQSFKGLKIFGGRLDGLSSMPDKPIPPHNQIIAVSFTSAFFIGIYFSTFLQSLRGLLFTHNEWELRPVKTIQWPILLASLSILALSAINHGVQLKFWMEEVLTTPPAVHTINWIDVAVVSLPSLC